MAYPRWYYDDPSKHVDFVRKKRKEHEERQPENKAERAKRELQRLFKEADKRA